MKSFKNLITAATLIALSAGAAMPIHAQEPTEKSMKCKTTMTYETKAYQTKVCLDNHRVPVGVFFKSNRTGSDWKWMSADELRYSGYVLHSNGLVDGSDALEPFYQISSNDDSSYGGELLTNIYLMNQSNSGNLQQTN